MKKAILIDIRNMKQCESGHIPEGVLIPVDELEDNIDNEISDRKTPIIVY